MNSTTRTRLRRLAVNAAIAMLSIVVAFGLVELAMRLLVQPAPGAAPPIFQPDAASLYTLRPGAVLQKTMPDGTKIKDTISSQGLREDFIGPKPPGEFRIVMIGDSFTLGGTTSRADTISGQLQKLIAERHPQRNVRVINLGVSGAGPWQQRIRLARIGWALQPDAVIQQLYLANDVGDTLAAYGEHLDACIPDWEYSLAVWRLQKYWRFRAEYWLQVHSRAYGALRAALGREAIVNFLCEGIPGLPKISPPSAPKSAPRLDQIEVDLANWYPKLTQGWKTLIDDVAGTAADCAQREIPYLAYNIPSYPELSDAEWTAQTTGRGFESKYERGKAERLTIEELTKRGVPAISIFGALHAAGPADELFYVSQGHLAAKGNAVVSAELLTQIESAQWLVQIADQASRTAVP